VTWEELCAVGEDVIALAPCPRSLACIADAFRDRVYAVIVRHLEAHEPELERAMRAEAARRGVPTVAAVEVLYHERSRQPLQDVLSCIRHGVTLSSAGTHLRPNAEHELLSWGKAGKTRWKGRRPKVRGEVMNPVDHPHGGRTRGGRNVVSPWGKKEGVKTRNKKKPSQRLIVRGRKRGKATQSGF
jgi:hypothetical protein